MVTESPVKRAPATLSSGNLDDYEESTDLDALLRDRERELNMYRSGSAPPTVEGSRAAFGSFFGHTGLQESHGINGGDAGNVISEEEIRSHPDYLSYYYSNGNFNPRLPPPALSKEDWRVAQRFRAGSIGDRRGRKQVGDGVGSSSSLFSLQPGIPMGGAEQEGMDVGRGEQRSRSRQASADWLEPGRDGLIGLPDVGLGVRRKSFADALQEKLGQPSPRSGRISRPISRNSFENIVTSVGASDLQLLQGSEIVDDLHSGATSPGLVRVQSVGSSISQSRLSGLGSSLARSRTPEPQLIRRSPSPCLPTVGGRMSDIDKNLVGDFNGSAGVSSHVSDIGEVAASLTSLSLSSSNMTNGENVGHFHQDFTDPHELLFKMQSSPNQSLQQKIINMPEAESYGIPTHPLLAQNDFPRKNGVLTDAELSNLNLNGQISRQMAPNNLYNKTASVGLGGSVNLYQDVDASSIDFTGSNSDAFSVNEATLSNHFDAGRSFMGGAERQHLSGIANQVGSGLHLSNVESLYAQHLQNTRDSAVQAALDPSLGRSFLGTSQMDLSAYQKAYLGAVLAQQKLQYAMPFVNKSGGLNHGIYGNSAFSLGMQYPTSPIPSSLSPLGSGSPLRQNERLSRFPTMMRGAPGASLGSWNPESRLMEDGYGSSLLEEFKNNKARTFELLEIVGHVVEFSGDQYGSRFIQQKLETASVEEKNKIFPEIFPHARDLMTDVFGNYVIQKFFEHGTDIQRKELASQLTGHVLSLSLQMYGCRVIQKALEVVDIDQQTQMVLELDGSIMKCVRDQNGNHVIQKCIECVPQERIQFIISSFYGQVVTLSAHPYGCRVIQRVLEHCDDAKTQSIMMDEILQSVCTLAQDQYGNYVVQHVLQHGKPEERSAIISKLAGQIVKMSQQKYASNVVEKCLTYGSSEERQILINEMLGSTDENEPLQAMMKDQFANYVVQKVIETCDDQNRELILSRIRVHLNALKRYTYGKHIVVRVEKLLTTGERRLGLSAYSS